ncbi:MAG: hypothetical protein P1V97_30060, partial [Planctomycetota bacterium]|nr:hypothetical protein [Planctomycetota bacterium]
RASSLRALALQPEFAEGTIETALLCLDQGTLKNRSEWILRSCSAEDMIAITVAATRGVVPAQTALKGLIATYSGLSGLERDQRIAELRGLREHVQGDLAHVILDSALAKNELLSIPSTTTPIDNSELQTKFRVALVTGGFFSVCLLVLAFMLTQHAGGVHGPGLDILWMIAKSFTALSIAIVGGLAMILSDRKNRELELKDRLRMQRQRAKEAFDKTMASPVWSQTHLVGTAIHDKAEERIFDPKSRKPGPPQKGQ